MIGWPELVHLSTCPPRFSECDSARFSFPLIHVLFLTGRYALSLFVVAAKQTPSSSALASLPGTAGMQFSLQKRIETHETTHSHIIEQKYPKKSMKSATRSFCEHEPKSEHGLGRSERVAQIIAFEPVTLQERRGRLLECAHEVFLPNACVGSEKIAKNIRVFSANLSFSKEPNLSHTLRLAARCLRYTRT